MINSREDVSAKLRSARSRGQGDVLEEIFPLVYDELRRLAGMVRGGSAGATLCTTALVHEAYLKLLPSDGANYHDKVHFFRVAARAMRQVLVDAARRRLADKRGGGKFAVTFDEGLHGEIMQAEHVIALEDALAELEAMNERQAHVVECRFYAGLSVEETASALDVSAPTVKRDWRTARAWLTRRLKAA